MEALGWSLRRHVVMMVVLLAFVAGCQTTTGQTAGEHLDDATVTSSVKTKLAGDRIGTLGQIEVETVRQTVYLTGVVPSIQDKARAEELARDVDGVREVVNNLQIQHQPR